MNDSVLQEKDVCTQGTKSKRRQGDALKKERPQISHVEHFSFTV